MKYANNESTMLHYTKKSTNIEDL